MAALAKCHQCVVTPLTGNQRCEDFETHGAAVVDESGQVSTLCSVDNGVVVHSEQVAAPDALLCVTFLSIVSNHLDR